MTAHRSLFVSCVLILVPALFLGLSPAIGKGAGLFDQLSESASKLGDEIAKGAGKIGDEISTGARKIAEDVGMAEKKQTEPANSKAQQSKVTKPASGSAGSHPPAAAKLPGGVTSRLKKMTAELDKAQRSMGTSGSRPSNQAYNALENAKQLKGEIDRQYAGQFAIDHPEVKPVYERYQLLSDQFAGLAAGAAAADGAATRNSAATALEVDCEEWNHRLQAFTQGDRALHVYATEDAAQMAAWKAAFDDSTAAISGYRASSLDQQSCPQAEGTLQQLNNYRENFQAIYANFQQTTAAAAANLGDIVFSPAPIDPGNPSGLVNTFQAGETIYGLIRATQPWSAIYKNDQEAQIRVDVAIDGKKIHAQFVTVREPAILAGNSLVFDIAPAPAKMTAYSTPHVEYGKSTATMRQGPNELTHHLGQLPAGSHTLTLTIQYYGTTYAQGQFVVQGADFSAYARLHQQIAAGVAQAVTLPAAKLVNQSLAAEMAQLLKNAGWPAVHRINIIDKDWWLDRMSGGDSPITSRHIAAAALARGENGYFYKVCTFHQDRLISGGFGTLYLSHQGDPVVVPEANIDK